MRRTKEHGLDRVVAIDWSGRVDTAGQRRHIWAGVWTAASVAKSGHESLIVEAGRTREELIPWLIGMARETPRMVVGIDCCFSYPAWFLKEHRCKTVFDLWQKVTEGKGEEWLHRDCADDRFWGKAGSRRHGRRPDEFCGPGLLRMMRTTDIDNKITPKLLQEEPERAAAVLGITPKSPFQIGGAGSVGTGTLRAMPMLLKLREGGFRTWPFEDARLNAAGPQPLLVEMYTRLLTGAVKKSNSVARTQYLAERRKSDTAYASLPRKVLTAAESSEDAFDALVCTLEMVRWQAEFPALTATEDKTLRLEGVTWRPGVQG